MPGSRGRPATVTPATWGSALGGHLDWAAASAQNWAQPPRPGPPPCTPGGCGCTCSAGPTCLLCHRVTRLAQFVAIEAFARHHVIRGDRRATVRSRGGPLPETAAQAAPAVGTPPTSNPPSASDPPSASHAAVSPRHPASPVEPASPASPGDPLAVQSSPLQSRHASPASPGRPASPVPVGSGRPVPAPHRHDHRATWPGSVPLGERRMACAGHGPSLASVAAPPAAISPTRFAWRFLSGKCPPRERCPDELFPTHNAESPLYNVLGYLPKSRQNLSEKLRWTPMQIAGVSG